ncbi:MAG: hypothetical protein JO267_09215 [Alphaproteobacteria bacterium]|nr:hypothetical protein [Alphaproteobacteria bacterium]
MRLQAQSTAPVPNAPPVQTGWNFLHPNDCIFYDDGSGLGPILAFYSQEEQQTRYWYTYEWQFQNMLQAACSVNYWVGFYVIDSAGDWTQLATFAR